MKAIFATILVVVTLTGAASESAAQTGVGAVTYQMSVPSALMKEFINDSSFRGLGLDTRTFLGDHTTVGLSFSWQVFDQQTTEPIELDGGTLTGKQFRYINSFPFLVDLHFYSGEVHKFRLFAGAGAGVYYMMRRAQLGVATLDVRQWYAGFSPEIGMLVPTGDVYWMLSARYHYAVRQIDEDEYSYLSVKVGVAYDHW